MVFHGFNQCVDGFLPKIIGRLMSKRIRLVNKKYTVESFFDLPGCLDRCLADISCHEIGAADLDTMSLAQPAQRVIDLAHQSSRCGLASPRMAREHKMFQERGRRISWVQLPSSILILDAVNKVGKMFLERWQTREI